MDIAWLAGPTGQQKLPRRAGDSFADRSVPPIDPVP